MGATEQRAIGPESCGGQDWIEQELAASTLPDARLEKRLRSLVEQLAKGVGRSIPFACQDLAAAKAAYRFFSKGRSTGLSCAGAAPSRVRMGRPPRRHTGFSPTAGSAKSKSWPAIFLQRGSELIAEKDRKSTRLNSS